MFFAAKIEWMLNIVPPTFMTNLFTASNMADMPTTAIPLAYNLATYLPPPSQAQQVAHFTEAAGTKVPQRPRPMTKDEVFNVVRHVISEMRELMSTVVDTREGDPILKGFVDEDAADRHRQPPQTDDPLDVAVEQADAIVDAHYYMLNAAAKAGINVDKFFYAVHAANMAKIDPETGRVLRRASDGKILKPPNWKPPCLTDIMRICAEYGSWD